ncbi:MAG: NAD(P)-dependent oxidoreductase [Proteobacteria bacterium]|nr:NAD(P)-dependent oxidoreductase [Pseudomonadota bacterium]
MKVGFIGLGRMGLGMADRLLAAGHDVGIYNRTGSKCDPLVARGALRMPSIAAAAKHGAILITMLENDAALDAVASEPNGIMSSLGPKAIHVAMGTHSVASVQRLADAHTEADQSFVSAPVLGRPAAARDGQLGIIVAGSPSAVEACRPLFAAMGRRTFDAGPSPVSAAAAKIVNNLLLACSIEAMGEGFALGRKCGLAPGVLFDVLTEGLFSGPAHKIYGRIIAESDFFAVAGFTATTGLKDVTLALAAARGAEVPLPSVEVCRERLEGAISRGNGDRDWSVMALEQAQLSGLT